MTEAMDQKNAQASLRKTLFLLTVTMVLMVLKLSGTWDLSWWWVTFPLWGGLAILLTLLAIGVVVIAIGASAGQR